MNRLIITVLLGSLLAGCGGGASGTSGTPVADVPPEATPAARNEPASAPTESEVRIIAQEFAYGATDDRNFIGYFATPEQILEPLPGVVLVHEWWGLNDSVRDLAERLAMAGYAVLAVDLYDRAVATDADAAQTLMAGALADRPGSLGNIGQAIDYLRAYALAPRVAVLGYGFGGGLVLEAALSMPEKVDAVITYYGRLVYAESELERLRAPLLGFFAEQDDSIAVRNVQQFRSTLQSMDKQAQVLIQIGAGHGFADPLRPGFNPEIAAESWAETIAFLGREIGRAER